MTSIEVILTRVKETKNFSRYEPENNEHLEDFQKGIWIPNSSPLSKASVLKLIIEILEE